MQHSGSFRFLEAARGFYWEEYPFFAIAALRTGAQVSVSRPQGAVLFFGTKSPVMSVCSNSSSFTFLSIPPA